MHPYLHWLVFRAQIPHIFYIFRHCNILYHWTKKKKSLFSFFSPLKTKPILLSFTVELRPHSGIISTDSKQRDCPLPGHNGPAGFWLKIYFYKYFFLQPANKNVASCDICGKTVCYSHNTTNLIKYNQKKGHSKLLPSREQEEATVGPKWI